MSKSELEHLDELSQDGLEFMHTTGIDADELNQEIHALIDEKAKTPPAKNSNKTKILVLLLAVLVSMVLAYYLSRPTMPQSNLVAQYYTTPPFMESNIERSGADQNASLSQISTLYNKADYTELTKLLNTTESGPLVFYKGVSQYESGDIHGAIESFTVAINTEYKDMAQWHLALSLITVDQYENATTQLQEIAKTSDHFKHNQAKELLQTLSEEK